MRHLGALFFATLLSAACASNPPPQPAASSDSVELATNQPNRGPDFSPASQDGVAAAERTSSAPSSTATARDQRVTPPANPSGNDVGTWGNGSEGAPSTDNSNGNAAAAPMDTPRAPVAPDNTRINSRDANGGSSLTPMDQGPSPADRRMTQQIRQEVMKDKSLSFTAKNVKIITINGKVTLRGPVKSEAERTAIEAAARRVAGSGAMVDSQLELAQ